MKYLSTVIIGLFTLVSFAQTEIDFHISGNIFNTKATEVKVARNTGNGFEDLASSPLSKKGDFDIKGKVPAADYYVLRVGDEYINIILRKGSDFKVYGDGKDLAQFSNIVGSDESAVLNKFATTLDTWNHLKDSAVAIITADRTQTEKINAEMQPHFVAFQNDFKAFVSENQNSAALIVALGAIDPSNDFASYESIVKQVAIGFPESPTVQSLLKNYAAMKEQQDAANMFAPGKVAPDFEELMLDRKTTMKLSDLRGQIVLLDFWASWCGPCRKENPNVVRLYNEYKDKGFTVMSVSLDGDLARWQQAIEQDGLVWPNHVSDLKKWSSAAAQKYQVRGIPFTVLIDKEGKIIQTNLRGQALEQALAELLGE